MAMEAILSFCDEVSEAKEGDYSINFRVSWNFF